ncbi:uncharacterized protein EDB93DRAFT_1097176 [Suillus bovinus]|uniref:uncharacterized protein n=1 Tax=Suillus bovinus TaxID=48563 RepID=UPI001B86739F|nr:uncharacterized protein EDB93DRAFT_1097176 [Suillus bovinus]KAG2126253.1 hypothetical protein EDB93DRAFT_1097176 [Suillus bovinus]
MARPEAITNINDQQTSSATPLLMAPSANHDAEQVTMGFSEAIKLDALGPMVVNSDGTLSRIANWEKMSKEEKDRTIRVVAARNRCVQLCRKRRAVCVNA